MPHALRVFPAGPDKVVSARNNYTDDDTHDAHICGNPRAQRRNVSSLLNDHALRSPILSRMAWDKGYFPYLYQGRPDPNDDPLSSKTSAAWDVHREMWGSPGEFVVDGNLAEVEYLDRLSQIKVPTLIIVGDHDESDP